ncbi:DUF2062 domain-containing protein [Cohnella sp. AR92]|nr:DUF2062 domain-containing protein [Cohnella sp. AR92]
MNRLADRLALSLFAPFGKLRGATAGSIGLFVGMLPIAGFRFALLLALSIMLRMSLPALVLGLSVTFLLPYLHLLTFSLGHRLAAHDAYLAAVPDLTIRNAALWTTGSGSYWAGSVISGLLLATLAFPFFMLLFNLPRKRRVQSKNYVFKDEFGRRWVLLRRLGVLTIGVALAIVAVFCASLDSVPLLPDLGLKQPHSPHSSMEKQLSENELIQQLKDEDQKHPTFQVGYRRHHLDRLSASSSPGKQEVYGFYVNWDENSKQSLLQYSRELTTLLPEWLHMNSDLTISDETDPDVLKLADRRNLAVQPLISNYTDDHWDEEAVHRLLQSPEKQQELIRSLHALVTKYGESGINLDFEAVEPDDQDLLTAFVQSLTQAFHADGLQVTQDVPADDDAFDYGALAQVADRLIVMMYDEHSETGDPGPIASSNWFEQSLNQLDIPPGKMVVSMGNYGYDWIANSKQPADNLTFGDLMELAEQSKLPVYWDDEGDNPYIRYQDGEDSHIVWFLDAATFYNQLKIVQENGFRGVALWRLGSEDPGIWSLLGKPSPSASDLSVLYNPSPVHYSGEGEILRIASTSNEGKRSVETDEDGYIDNETYESIPTPFEVERYGKIKSKQVALTFDDGPSGRYTPEILDILNKYKIKASFFVVGENAEAYPGLIKRIYKEGHELGNHTFTHPDVAAISPTRTRLELNATQRLIQEITGHSATFFRPPYVADAEPSTPSELLPILRAQQMGYTMAGELIDPEDWQRPSTDAIVDRVMSRLHEGNVILLHDAGGDRSQTVEALPRIIEQLQRQGYSFTTLSALIGKTRAETMPPVSDADLPLLQYDRAVFQWLKGWNLGLRDLFYAAIAIGMLRVAMLFWLSLRHKRDRSSGRVNADYAPPVSVVIAAYNEQKVICNTIESILLSDYPNYEVIVVDDGSTDETARAVLERFGERSDVRLITKPNGGKASAVNTGYRQANGEIVIAFDADTLIASDSITRLVCRFQDERVAAVSGNVKIGNTGNLLTIWQHIEYVTGFNLERRAFDKLNCIAVVPGAIGAWRKSAVEDAGYYSEDTLAEDADLTLSLLRSGYKIHYEERALAYTEAPEDVQSFAKQRYRWTYGTLQCLWKHRGAMFNPKHPALGFIGMPNMWLFQYVYSVLSPLIDLLFVFSLFSGGSRIATAFYLAFFLLDLSVAYYAFRLEKENPKPLLWLFLQRIVYRQLMTYVILKSIFAAVRGSPVGWNKMKRRGSARMDQSM